jgi:hypothetical protein
MLGPALHEMNVPQFAPEGLNFGYYYDASPIVVPDGEAPPAYEMGHATPSTVPGCRMPHFLVEGGASVYDRLGQNYTLVRFDPGVDVGPLVSAARAARVPLEVLDVARPSEPDVFSRALLIVRPDQHVAWRGDAAPEDSAELIERLRGARR